MDRAGDVPLRDVSHLVRKDTSQFAFVACRLQQARMYADITTRKRKCIDVRIVDDEKCKALTTVIGLGRDATPDLIDVLGNQRVLDHVTRLAELRHDRSPDPRLLRL